MGTSGDCRRLPHFDDDFGRELRLDAGGTREMHWHQQSEWAIMTYGNCRITILDEQGRMSVSDVKEGDLWFFPAGLPHSLQGLGPDGAEFVLVFDNGAASEFNTLLPTDWLAHTPPDVLAKNFGVPVEAFKNIPLQNKWIFQSTVLFVGGRSAPSCNGPGGIPEDARSRYTA